MNTVFNSDQLLEFFFFFVSIGHNSNINEVFIRYKSFSCFGCNTKYYLITVVLL